MEIIEKYFGGWVIPGKMVLAELNPDTINRSYRKTNADIPLTAGPICYFVVLDGWLDITVDKKTVRCERERNNFAHISPFNVLYKAKASDDVRGFLLCLSKKFMDENLGGKRPFNPEDVQEFQLTAATTVDSFSMQTLHILLRGMNDKFGDTDHIFRQEIVILKAIEFIFEFASVIHKQKQSAPIGASSNSDLIIKQLFPILVKNCRKHHEVSFYAEQLCITPQYLNKLVRTKLGKPASSLIADVLITEAVVLLQDPQLSIQQVAEQLNFSDQSSFGKFFKKHTGQTPGNYRREL